MSLDYVDILNAWPVVVPSPRGLCTEHPYSTMPLPREGSVNAHLVRAAVLCSAVRTLHMQRDSKGSYSLTAISTPIRVGLSTGRDRAIIVRIICNLLMFMHLR